MPHIEQIRPELTWRLRRDVLYPNKKIFEMELDDDENGMHFGAFESDKLVGVVSLFQNGSDCQFRKLAVDIAAQKTGIGTALLNQITQHARENGGLRLWCNARVTAAGFYQKAGFYGTGHLFSKNGNEYEVMEKDLLLF